MSDKKTVIVNIDYEVNWDEDTDVSFEQIKTFIREAEDKGATHLNVSSDSWINFNWYQHRLETEEEYQNRLAQERERAERRKKEEIADDIQLLKKLKAKYPDHEQY